MAIDFMSLLGAMMQGGAAPSAGQRVQSAASSLGDLVGGLLGSGSGASSAGGLDELLSTGLSMGQGMMTRASKTAGGKDNLAAAGVGALLGALTNKNSSTMGGLGGGLMGLLGMMAYKALSGSGEGTGASGIAANVLKQQAPTTPVNVNAKANANINVNDDAKVILMAMVDAAKADGEIDRDEMKRISDKVNAANIGQEGVNYIIQLIQAPMATNTIAAATRGRPELAAQVYMASLMAIEVDTKAERNYLDRLAKAIGLTPAVARNIEQLMGVPQVC